MALFDNLIAYYKLDGNCRDSVNIYDGIPNNITFVDGKIGKCVQTNGNSQYISLLNEVSVKGRTQVSYSGWCFIESTLSNEFYIITEIANSDGYTRATFGVSADLLPFAGVRTVATGDNGSFQKVTGTSPMSTGTWYFLCGVFDLANGNITLYVNGVSVGSLNVTASSFVNANPYRIRIFEFESSGSGNVRVDEVGIWSKALSAAEVSELYNNGAGKTYSTGTSGGTGVVIDGLFLSTSKPTAGDKGLLINNKFFIPFAKSSGSGGTSAEYYKCDSVDTGAKTWSGYKAVFDSGTGTWSFEDTVTEGLEYNFMTPSVGGVYDADCTMTASLDTGEIALLTPHIMTSASDGEWTVTASAQESDGNRAAWKVFDGRFGENYGWSGYPNTTGWLMVEHTTTFTVKRLKLSSGSMYYGYNGTLTISGSNTGNDFTDIWSGDNPINGSNYNTNDYQEIDLSTNTLPYKFLKLYWKGVSNRLYLGELEIWGR